MAARQASRSSCVSRTVQRRATTDNGSEGRPNGRAEAPRLLLEGTGLKLVPVVEASPKPAAATRRRKPQAEPTIRWQEGTRSFFFSGGFEKAGGEAVLNAEGFPLLLFRGLLGNQALARACDLAAELHGAGQVIKQHELKAGKPRTIRRSLVHRLQPGASQPAAHAARSASSMLLDLIWRRCRRRSRIRGAARRCGSAEATNSKTHPWSSTERVQETSMKSITTRGQRVTLRVRGSAPSLCWSTFEAPKGPCGVARLSSLG